MLTLSTDALDALTQTATVLDTFAGLIEAKEYVPYLDTRDPADLLLAEAYDQAQAERGDPRRAGHVAVDDLYIPKVIRLAQARAFLGLDLD
jgi:hypothetical protein